ncbi:type IX secretion system membrane protein PorP/SprF [Adhaeribacter soli]|uniref:Type IX secretion system membrane protein PorP/SprF n=2 Tax=Adhaeribacter soli TaxID=2607655 RepID=A0A5N1J074_9BACT|nr:type IX secretion system membrane protein PorP/SprF [Adhaeribacter soli]
MRWSGKVKFLMGCFLALGSEVFAQDAHFSQQYATRLLLNPAFAGLTAEASASAAYRNQWPSLSGAFVTNYLSGDIRLGESKSSVGVQMLLDQSGSAGFTQFGFNGIYSYRTRISKNLAVSAGLQAGYGSQKVDFTNLTFGDQFTDDGLQNEVSAETNNFDPVRYITLGTGGILYSDQLWLSISANHLNQPDLGNTTESRLPLKVILNTGYKFYAYTHYSENKFYELSFTPTATYIKHGPFSRTDVGLYTLYTPVTVGILYRGVPVGGTKTEQSLVFIGGIQLNAFRMAYSYDLGLSGLSASTGGAHEVSLAFHLVDYTKIFKNRARNKNSLEIACPAF